MAAPALGIQFSPVTVLNFVHQTIKRRESALHEKTRREVLGLLLWFLFSGAVVWAQKRLLNLSENGYSEANSRSSGRFTRFSWLGKVHQQRRKRNSKRASAISLRVRAASTNRRSMPACSTSTTRRSPHFCGGRSGFRCVAERCRARLPAASRSRSS